tara:strand:+ start:683 stop:1033 length:351 start_codon:yes stop_codon:yes gene_type:complete
MSETTGQKRTRSPSRVGDISEYYAVTWLWDNGYEVFLNAGSSGPVDMIAMDKDGNTILIDVKTMQKDYRTTNNIYTQRKQRTEIQKDLGVKIVSFNPKTRKLNFVNHKEENQLELF